ncbi:MAG: hypothetical protein KDE45_05565 [Caldilineaceae bacterium]|nr:hypothetical protein [Caldilineaceae bacterium]
MIDVALRDWLLGFPLMADAVGERIYPGGLFPQGVVLPAVAFKDVSNIGSYTNDEGVTAWREMRYQFNSQALTLMEARNIDALLMSVLDGYRGPMGPHQVTGIFQRNSFPQYQETAQQWRMVSDYTIQANIGA